MMKLILFVVIGLLVGIGGGSAVSVMNAKKAYAADVAHKASVVADSLAKVEEEGVKHVADQSHVADSAAVADSTLAETHGTDAGAQGSAAKDTPAGTRTPSTRPSYSRAVQTVESNGAPGSLPRAATRPTLPPKPMSSTAPTPGAAKVAKILAAMPPKDAATVLEQLDDSDVQSVISSLNEKQAAAILRNFPAARAAEISKAVLRAVVAKP